MLEAARSMFAEQGYEATTTKGVAESADVSEAVLFRNFGSKEGLFEAAVLEPFQEFVETYTAAWQHTPGAHSVEWVMASYVDAVFELVQQNRALLTALVRNGLGLEGLAPAIRRLDAMGADVAAEFGLVYDTEVVVRATLLMVVSTALAGDSLFDGQTPISPSRVRTELTRMLVAAAMFNPASPHDGSSP